MPIGILGAQVGFRPANMRLYFNPLTAVGPGHASPEATETGQSQ
jgi:hypothetical protein